MKKILITVISALLLIIGASALSSCGQPETITLNVYNWGEYISDGSEDSLDVNAAFEEYYYETYGVKVKVNYTTFASNEDLYAKLKSGASGYDVIVPSDYMIARMIDEEMLEKLDYSNIPNYEYIGEEFRGLFYDKNNEYTVPYTYGMVGIIYNSAKVDEEDLDGWNLLWNEKYKGQILQFNNSRDAFGSAMYKLGIDVNTEDVSEWRRALAELAKQKPIVQSYVMDEVYNKMESGEAWIAAYYAGDYLTMWENNNDLEFYYPEDENGLATNAFIDAMCIPKGARNKATAEAYINFMLSEEPAIANAEYIYYASPNSLVYENEEYIDYLGEDMEILYPEGVDFSEMYDSYCYKNLSDDMLGKVNSLWEELKIEAYEETDYTVYIVCGVLAGFFVVVGVYNFIKKRRRAKWY